MSSIGVYDVKALRKLNRRQIQDVAKKNGVKANGKTAILIHQLVTKFPDGVPREAASNTIPATRRRTSMKIKTEQEEEPDETRRTNKSRKMSDAVIEEGETQLPSVLEQSASSGTPVAAHVETAHREDAPQNPRGSGLGAKDVRLVKRELTKLVDGAAEIRGELAETRTLVEYMKTEIIQQAGDQLAHLGWINYATEDRVLRQFKRNRRIWDGTPFMQPGPKQAWKGFLNGLVEENLVESLNSAARYETKRRRRSSQSDGWQRRDYPRIHKV